MTHFENEGRDGLSGIGFRGCGGDHQRISLEGNGVMEAPGRKIDGKIKIPILLSVFPFSFLYFSSARVFFYCFAVKDDATDIRRT